MNETARKVLKAEITHKDQQLKDLNELLINVKDRIKLYEQEIAAIQEQIRDLRSVLEQ